MLGYFWKRFTASEGAVSNIAHIQINDYESAIAERDIRIESLERHIAQQDDMIGNLAEEIKHLTAQRDAQVESLKQQLQHKTDLAESYKGATERRDERIKELERQNNEYILQYAMQSDSVAVLEKQISELSREREEFVQKYESARDAMREMKCLIHQHQRAFDSEYRRSFDECEPDSILSPKGDKNEHVANCEELRKYFPKVNKPDGDTAEYPAPVNAIADTTSHGE